MRDFAIDNLPELIQAAPGPALINALCIALDKPPADLTERLRRHERILQQFSFDQVAQRLISRMQDMLDQVPPAAPVITPRDAGTARMVLLSDPAASAPGQRQALQQAAREITAICDALTYPRHQGFPRSPVSPDQGVIHPLMWDLRQAQALTREAGKTPPQELCARAAPLAARARRISDALRAGSLWPDHYEDTRLVRVMRDEPLWDHAPEEYTREVHKHHVPLWPRGRAVALARPIGVFLHLYYEELGAVFADRLNQIGHDFALYISTDSKEKADHLRDVFPDSDIRVTPNRGRDIFPKFYCFSDAYDRHDIVLHLHGKRSLHADALDGWLAHNLDCLLPPPAQITRILSLFDTIPELGLISPVTFRQVLSVAHWNANYEIAQELAHRMGLSQPLPGDRALRFPVGSMFWARVAALRPLLDLNLRAEHFPPEAGQIDGTTAHAIERLVGVSAAATGFAQLNISARKATHFPRYRRVFASNRDLREALIRGELNGESDG